jgi:Flp pilus assembly protein TadD
VRILRRARRSRLAIGRRLSVACLLALGLGCASAPPARYGNAISVDELRSGAVLGAPAPPGPVLAPEEILAVSPEMQAFLDAHVTRHADRAVRVRQLAYAIVGEGRFGLQYDETTRTAAETFRTRHGNCLSFSCMFVAMARRVGLDAAFQEVDIPPDWTFADDAFVLNRHVNVAVDLGREGEHVVDFNMDDFRTTYDRRRISDERALAHFYNNVAVEKMRAGDDTSALLFFRSATGHDPQFSPAWTNLGILYSRKGHPAYAEAAYLQALKADAGDLVAMSNLANLYAQRGLPERAAFYRRRVAHHREQNPYFRYQMARRAYQAGDYDAAIRQLGYAIHLKRNEDQFYYLLGLSHLKKGDEEEARRWLVRAREVAATDALKRRYDSKIGVLLPPGDERRR